MSTPTISDCSHVTFNNDNTVTFVANPGFTGPTSFTYTVTDDRGATATATVNGTVFEIGTPTTFATPTAPNTPEDTSLNITDLQITDDNTTITVTVNVASGTLALGTTVGLTSSSGDGTDTLTLTGPIADVNNALRTLVYTPLDDFHGTVAMQVEAQSPTDPTPSTTTFDITVTPVQDTVADAVVTPEATALTFDPIAGDNGSSADNFEGIDANILSVSQGANGSVTFTGTSVTYTPNPGFTGQDTFTYTANTLDGIAETETVTVDVLGRPIAQDNTQAMTEGTTSPLGGNVITDTDATSGTDSHTANRPLTVNQIDGRPITGPTTVYGTYGRLEIQPDGTYQYFLDNSLDAVRELTDGSTDQETFAYTVTGGTFESTANLNFDITGINDPPIVDLDSIVPALNNPGFNQAVPAGTNADNWSLTNVTSGSVTTGNGSAFNGSIANPDFARATLSQQVTSLSGGQLKFSVATRRVDSQRMFVQVYYAGSLLANVASAAGSSTQGSISTASGVSASRFAFPISSGAAFDFTDIVIDVPSSFPDSGLLEFRWTNSGVTSDDPIAITNVEVVNDLDYETTFVEDAGPVSIADTDASTFDSDNANLQSAEIILTNGKAGDLLSFSSPLPGQLTLVTPVPTRLATAGTTTIQLTGDAPKSVYDEALRSIQFDNDRDVPDQTDRILTVKINDGGSDSNTAISTITIQPTNDPPVAVDDGIFDVVGGQTFDVRMLDNDSDPEGGMVSGLRVRDPVTGTQGSISPTAGTSGLTTANGTRVIKISGVNDVLEITPDATASGLETIEYSIQDEDGGTATATITIRITPVEVPPEVDLDGIGQQLTALDVTNATATSVAGTMGDTAVTFTITPEASGAQHSFTDVQKSTDLFAEPTFFNNSQTRDAIEFTIPGSTPATDTALITINFEQTVRNPTLFFNNTDASRWDFAPTTDVNGNAIQEIRQLAGTSTANTNLTVWNDQTRPHALPGNGGTTGTGNGSNGASGELQLVGDFDSVTVRVSNPSGAERMYFNVAGDPIDHKTQYIKGDPAVAIAPDGITTDQNDDIDGLFINFPFGGFPDGADEKIRMTDENGQVIENSIGTSGSYQLEFRGEIFRVRFQSTRILIDFSGRPLPQEAFADVIKSMEYFNTAVNPTDGIRELQFQPRDDRSEFGNIAIAQIEVTDIGDADLVTVKTLASADATPNEGDTVTFQIEVTNRGPFDSTNVTLTDVLPDGLTATANHGTASQGTYNAATGLWTVGAIANGAAATLTLVVCQQIVEGYNRKRRSALLYIHYGQEIHR